MAVILFDYDGVLFDDHYQTNVIGSDLVEMVKKIKQQGHVIVPNSDTPASRLRAFAKSYLDFDPQYMIAEKGAVVSVDGKRFFSSDIQGIIDFQRALKEKFLFKCLAFSGDSVTTFTKFDQFPPKRKVLYVDMIREQTLAFFARVTDEYGHSQVDYDWLKEVEEVVVNMTLPEGLLPFEYNYRYGIAIANVAQSSKVTGFQILKKQFSGQHFYMVGDSLSDYLEDVEVTHCAVANASEDYREHCACQSDKNYTAGLMDIFNYILTRENRPN